MAPELRAELKVLWAEALLPAEAEAVVAAEVLAEVVAVVEAGAALRTKTDTT
jgi:hypothetical protein